MASTKVQRIMTQPINLIFRFLQSKARIQIWLFEQKDLRIEGRIIGFDEYMNLVLEEAEELNVKKKTRKPLGVNDYMPLLGYLADSSIPRFYFRDHVASTFVLANSVWLSN
ncbi:Small nuclear ribonucleoprotein E [Musa troglodytarum]|uniref:Small nuclear ribonucleoprotein E n=1 Tax=Musa troglodytarum TaxID=320322 RepID=A0A9E7F2Z2_9LILI|nr:Small nuclear ribonucleoprotein E [Musa troglodytarum]